MSGSAAECERPLDREAIMSRMEVVRPRKRRELLERLEQARQFLSENAGRPVKLDEPAGIALLSPFHFARHFKTAFGETPMAFHRRLRLQEAARLLQQSDLPLSAIAESLGYSDAASFSHAFRRHFGRAPRSAA